MVLGIDGAADCLCRSTATLHQQANGAASGGSSLPQCDFYRSVCVSLCRRAGADAFCTVVAADERATVPQCDSRHVSLERAGLLPDRGRMAGVSLPSALSLRRTAHGAAGAELQRGSAQCAAHATRPAFSLQCAQYDFVSGGARAEAGAADDRAPGRSAAVVAGEPGPAGGSAD